MTNSVIAVLCSNPHDMTNSVIAVLCSNHHDVTNSVIAVMCSNPHDMANSIIVTPEIKAQTTGVTASNTALVCVTVCTGVGKRLHTLPSHPRLGEPLGLDGGTLTSEKRLLHREG